MESHKHPGLYALVVLGAVALIAGALAYAVDVWSSAQASIAQSNAQAAAETSEQSRSGVAGKVVGFLAALFL